MSDQKTQPDAGEMPKILGPDFIVDSMNLYLCSSLQAYGRQCFAAGEAKERAKVSGLVSALKMAREYLESELATQRVNFKGHENCSEIQSIESDLAEIDAALRAALGEEL
jgi:hypothetical protein